MKTTPDTSLETTVAARIAGEDISVGDFVAVMSEVIELPSFLWSCSTVSLPADELVRLRCMASDAGIPHQVIGVCLPFVYVKTPSGSVITIDTRQRQLVRLDEHCARAIWKAMNPTKSKKRK